MEAPFTCRRFGRDNSEAWFGIAVAKVRLRNIMDELVKFDMVVDALSKECLWTVLNLVTDPQEDDSYETIKKRLCDHHQLTEYQQVKKLHAMVALSGRKPSELLHEMLDVFTRVSDPDP
jgi:hypothetical protein